MRKMIILVAGLMATQAWGQTQQSATPAPTASRAAATTTVPATQTSTTTAETVKPTDDKKWSALILATAGSDNIVKTEEEKNNGQETTFSTLHAVQFGYKIGESKISLRQYFNSDSNLETDGFKADISQDGLNPTVILFSTPFTQSFLGSSPVTGTFWYYAPTQDNDRNINGNGNLRLDLSPTWELGKGFSISYYFRPSQSFVPTQVYDNPFNGQKQFVTAQTSVLQGPILNYAVNDNINLYGYTWIGHYFRTEEQMKLHRIRNVYEIGAEFMINKNVTINPLIAQDLFTHTTSLVSEEPREIAYGSTGDTAMAARPEELTYEVDLIVTF